MSAPQWADRIGPLGRQAVESVVGALAAAAPADWTRLHADFAPPEASVLAYWPGDLAPVALSVPPAALDEITTHQREAALAGEPWERLVVDCDRTGQLSVRTVAPRRPGVGTRRATVALAVLAVLLTVAAAVIFLMGPRRDPPPPRAVPPVVAVPSAREQQAQALISDWFAAASRGDAAGMRALGCPDLGPHMGGWAVAIEHYGPDQIIYFDGLTAFSDDGTTIVATAVFRSHPLSDEVRAKVADDQPKGGFFEEFFQIVTTGGDFKVCGP
jgi:hypothetical protein